MKNSIAVMMIACAASAGAQGPRSSPPPIAGILCEPMEGQRIHIHQHLMIIDRGQAVSIPPNVGQRPTAGCLYWLHTHTPDGIIHIEAPKERSFTLGDFFKVWGEPLSKTRAASAEVKNGSLKIWVDGKPYTGDPAAIGLTAHRDIVIMVGPPFVDPPRFTAWGTL